MSQSIEHVLQQLVGEVRGLAARVGELEVVRSGGTAGLHVGGATGKKKAGSEGSGSVSTELSSGAGRVGSVAWSDVVEEESSVSEKGGVVEAGGVVAGGKKSEVVKEGSVGVVVEKSVEKAGGGVDVSVSIESVEEAGESAGKKGVSSSAGSVSSADSDAVLEMPAGWQAKALAVKFGGEEQVFDAVQSGGFRTYVRNGRVMGLKRWLKDVADVHVGSRWMRHLALSTYAAGSMPLFFVRGKEEMRVLAVIGDAALTLALARHSYAGGNGVESMQQLRSKALSDVTLREKLNSSDLKEFIIAPSGVDLRVSKAGATAVEAIAGVLDMASPGGEFVYKFAQALGLF